MVWDRSLARRARVAGIALVLAACTGGGLAGTRIPAAELRELVPGATLAGTVAGGGTFEGTYHGDGTIEIHTRKDGVADSEGRWTRNTHLGRDADRGTTQGGVVQTGHNSCRNDALQLDSRIATRLVVSNEAGRGGAGPLD